MARYAAGTEVTAERSFMEIRRTLARYGAEQFLFGEEPGQGYLAFRMGGRSVRLRVPHWT